MQALKTLAIVASLFAASAAMADSSVVDMENVNQSQGGSRNSQLMELGTVDGGIISGGTARVRATNITQSQTGNDNRQEMILGKINKDFGNHSTTVTANRVSQFQSGSNNTQRMKVGVVE